MRSRILSALLAAQLVAFPAFAQEAPEGEEMSDEGEAPASEVEGAEVVDPPSSVRTADGKSSAPGEVHTVVKGDTLWDLSQRFLGSPWYWPKVWSYNPEIANPHWIYPGNLVRFFPTGEEVPTQVEVGSGPPMQLDEEVNPADMLPEGAEDEVQVAGKIGYTPKVGVRLNTIGFVTTRELEAAGEIVGSFRESEMLSFPDEVYLSFKNKGEVRVGDRYQIFNTISEVKHPVSGAFFGVLTHVIGQVKVVAIHDKVVTAQILSSSDDIRRGAKVGPFGEEMVKSVTERRNERELEGRVVVAIEPYLTIFGEHQLIVIDKGQSDGVQAGNTFTVTRQGDGLNMFHDPTQTESRFPVETIATCMAVQVRDRATTCLLTRSMHEVVRGDRVVMKVAKAGERVSRR